MTTTDLTATAPQPAPLDLDLIDPRWNGTCNCEDQEAHGPDCRQGHGPDCPADCWSALGCPRRHDHAAPEPDSGPGWDRAGIEAAADLVPAGLRRQLDALLADRDQGWALLAEVERKWLAQAARATAAERERDAARAELAEERRDRANITQLQREACRSWAADVEQLRAELAEAQEGAAVWKTRAGEWEATARRHEADRKAALAELDRRVRDAQATCADDLRRVLGLPDTGTDWQGHRSWADWWADLTQRQVPAIITESRRRGMVADNLQGEVDRLRAELAKVTAQRDAARNAAHVTATAYGEVESERDQARTELAEALNDVDDRDATIGTLRDDLNHQTGAAIDNQAEAERLRAELTTARRDAAVAALDEAIRIAHGLVGGAEVEEVLRFVAAEVRAGTRTVGGSPEPAPGGGEEAS